MKIWSNEIKDLEKVHDLIKGNYPKLDNELQRLIKTDDENIVLVYARRCLEVMITDLCERELKRPRGTEPLKGIIDKLNKEEKVPHNIIVSMQNLNSLSTFGAHPKDFDPMQVKPVLLDLTTTLKWYLMYLETQAPAETEPGAPEDKRKEPAGAKKAPAKPKNRILLASAVVLVCAVIVVALILTDMISGGKQVKTGDIKSLVILPFENFTGDDQLEWFVSAMHASLIQDMGRISGLRVICKTSSDVYKNADMSASEIASELDVDAVMEAQVLCLGDSICTLFNLIHVSPEEKQVLTVDIKEGKRQILSLYNRITKRITDEVKIELTADDELLLAESREVDPDALDAYYKGLSYLDMINMNSLQKAKEYFNIAVEIEPDWAPLYAGLASVWGYQKQMSFISPSVAIPKIYENLNKALELDPNSSNSHYAKAIIAVWTEWNWEKGEEAFIKSLELNPSNALCRMFYAHLLMILQRPDEAIHQANLALKLDPLRPLILGLGGVVIRNTGDVQSAIALYEKALSIDPNHRFANYSLSGAYRQIGDYEKWFEYFKKIEWNDDKVLASIDSVFQEQGYLAAVEMTIKIDEEAANERYIDINIQGFRYLEINNYEKAMDCYEKGYEIHHPNMPYMGGLVINYDKLKDNPRYIELLKKMNLPLPKN